jgi:hypothetical protein
MSTDLNEFGKRPANFEDLALELAMEMDGAESQRMAEEQSIAGEQHLTEKEDVLKTQPEFAKDARGCSVINEAFVTRFMDAEHTHPILQHIVEYIKNLRFDRDTTQMAFSSTMGELVRAKAVKAKVQELVKDDLIIDQAFGVAVMKGQHSDRIPQHIQEYIESLCQECDPASLSFADVEDCLTSANPEDEQASACLFEVKEMVWKAKAGTAVRNDWIWSDVAGR